VPTVGNITMDMCMIDVTGIDAREGDEVIIFNEQQRINELATQIGTIPYEILTNVSQRVKRVYFYE
jgi:alanine racemase